MHIGTFSTEAAFIVSQKRPSEVLASPIVPKATSFPPLVNFSNPSLNSGFFLNTLEAWANPNNLGICPAVGEMSEDEFFCDIKSFHVPSSFKFLVA